jgi:MerR family mercuric resistance operon transcriptional regulator
MTRENFTIGTLAKQAGVNVETIRFYQRRGLLAEPDRPLGGVRRYTERDTRRIRFIKQGQKLGFSLDEIAELLGFEDGMKCPEAREIALRKLAVIRERIAVLQTLEETLAALTENCARNAATVSCPIILTLSKAAE